MSTKESNNKKQRIRKGIRRVYSTPLTSEKTQGPPGFVLHDFVYRSTVSAWLCAVLIFSFLGQGVYVVQAAELVEAEVVAIPVEISEPLTESKVVDEVVEDTPTVPAEAETTEVSSRTHSETESDALDTEVGVVVVEEEILSQTTVENEEVDETLEGGSVSTTDGDSSDSDTETASEEVTSVAENNPNDEVEDGAGSDSSGTSEEEIGDEGEVPLTATTSDLLATGTDAMIGPSLTEPIGVNYSDSGFMFGKNECTELASGSFYCLEPRENVLEDALFAAPDKDGDLEIFLVRGGIQSQITDNFIDDAAPFFDQNSETMVWHRLIEDRYQIISYDLASGEETQLTRSGTNNMEPVRQGTYTVWQRWVNNNWEVVLYDGTSEEQISHASAHDIAPYIHGALVVWNRYGAAGEKTIEMYDIASKTYVTVDDPEGLSVKNPRMVLVYDQMHPNGDIVTKGYDMIARKFIQLDTLPRDLPDEIPASEPTSETRALIQSKPTVKGDGIEVKNPTTTGEPPVSGNAVSSTSSDPYTLDLSQDGGVVLESIVVDEAVPQASELDLFISPYSTTTDSVVESEQE
jgi:hypothetical protein